MVKVLEELESTELLPVAPWLMICSFQLIEKLLRGELGLSTMSVAPVSNKKRSVSLSFTRQCMYTRLSFLIQRECCPLLVHGRIKWIGILLIARV